MEALALIVFVAGCGLSDEECLKVRGEAFDVLNEPHTCNHDTDCDYSDWPGCAKPVSNKNNKRVTELRGKFTEGGCKDEPDTCREPPDSYCKQGLCVFRELAGGKPNPTK